MSEKCLTCGEIVNGQKEARKHTYKTSGEHQSFQSYLEEQLDEKPPDEAVVQHAVDSLTDMVNTLKAENEILRTENQSLSQELERATRPVI